MLTACHQMQSLTGIDVKHVDFSDPQGGKGACNRKAASLKAHIQRYINEGHDVVSADDYLRLAILSNSGMRGIGVCLVDSTDVKTSKSMTAERANLMNNFLKLTIWRAYNIDKGKSLEWCKFPGTKLLRF